MTHANTSHGGLDTSIETQGRKEEKNIQGLLKEAVIREFSSPIDPEKFDRYSKEKDSFHGNVIVHMKDICREEHDDWYGVTDENIEREATMSAVSEQVARMSKGLVLMRKRFMDRATELFPRIKEQADWHSVLDHEMRIRDEKELQNLVTRTALMRKLVYRMFPSLQSEQTFEVKDFEKIFHDKDQYFDEEGKKRFLRIYRNYTHGQAPDREDIEFILLCYGGASESRKKDVLSSLGVVLSIKSAYELGLIDLKFLSDFAQESMGEVYASLDQNQKDAFVRGLAQDETYVVPAKDFQESSFAQVFTNDRKRRKLADEVARSMLIDMPEAEKSGDSGILSNIRRRKIQEAEAKGEKEEDYDLYEEFVNELQSGLKNTGAIKNIHLLKTPGCVIQFHDPQNGIQHVRVKRTTNEDGTPLEAENGTTYGVELEGLATVDGQIRENQNFIASYDVFKDFLTQNKEVEILRSEDFGLLVTKDPKEAEEKGLIYDARAIDADPATAGNIATKLDLLDSEGRAFGFEKGTCFVAPATDESGKSQGEEVWMVKKITGDTVDLVDSQGFELVKNHPLSDFYNVVASTPSFKRIAKITSDGDMLKELQEFGVDQHAKLKDGKLFVEDSHGHDDHGHGHGKEQEITCFESGDGGHIRLQFIQDGRVRFGEYASETEVKKAREYAQKKGIGEKELNGLYTWKTLSYPAFLKYLEKNKLKATSKDLIVPDAAHDHHGDHHHEHAHMTGSFFKRLLKWQNPASIWKGFEMIMHSIEHTLEKGAKLDAARFAMQTSRFLRLPDTVDAQIYSDIVNESKQIIEKYENKIFGLPGPAGRWKCIHIVHDRDSRPEEVMSAINYMLKSYGHLYAEDVKHYQSKVTSHNIATADPGYFAFLDGFILTSKLPGGLIEWRKKAYKKAISEMGTEDDHEGEPTEEQLIHAIFKTVDGNWEQYPYAASVVKASGGPSGFEKNWKFEGFENAYKKGKDQTQMVNAQGRLNKAVGYFNTHEIYKAIGSMEMVAAKVKDPGYQAMPFIWAVGGYSRHASHTALQKLKVYAEQGMSFHAYAFLRNQENNDIYRETVRLALKQLEKDGEIESGALDAFNKICERLENGPEDTKITDSKYNKESPAAAMMKFWQKYEKKGLHDMLQGQNGWLAKMDKDGNSTIQQYRARLVGPGGAHTMTLKDNSIPGLEFGTDWFKEHGYQNLILAAGPNGMNSLFSMLNKIQFEGTSPGAKPMNQEHREKIWNYVRKYMNGPLRDQKGFLGDENLQKEQYLFHRQEIIHYFAEKLTAHGIKAREANADKIIETNLRTFPYYQDLAEMGIDPHAVFDDSLELKNAEADYQRWKSGTIASISQSSMTIPRVEDMVRGKSHNVIDFPTQSTARPKAGPRMKRGDWKPQKPNSWEAEWQDDDALYHAGSADIVGDHDSGNEDEFRKAA